MLLGLLEPFLSLLLLLLFISVDGIDANSLKEKQHQPRCETAIVTEFVSETLIYPTTHRTTLTVTKHGPAKKTTTITEAVGGETVTMFEGGAAAYTTTITSTSVIAVGGDGTRTVTSTVWPHATTTVTATTFETVQGTGTRTIVYPEPAILTESMSNRYTGAPASLFLSVI